VHAVLENYLTTGEHEYDVDVVYPGDTVIGTIKFISPEAYPRSLWIGKVIKIQEASKLIGHAKIIEIYNETLLKT